MEKIKFIEILMVIIFLWILIDLYGKALNTFTYSYLKLDPENAWHAFVIALAVTGIILAFLFTNTDIGNKLEDQISGYFDGGPDIVKSI
jgi:hypothetical protein